MIKYVGKSLLIETPKERALVIGDLHLGYQDALKRSGFMMPGKLYEYIKKDIVELFDCVGAVTVVILLGDVKHEFGFISQGERTEAWDLINYLKDRSNKVVIIKGNHDVLVDYIIDKEKVSVQNYFIWNEFCFVHGDRDFPVIYDKTIRYWIMGHAHPAITLREGSKAEKYKCFLVGKYKDKNVIILPSFFSANEGTDPRDFELDLAWPLKIETFEVKVVGDKLEVLNFGKISRLPLNRT